MDLAVQEYANFEAVFILLEDNPHLQGLNDYPQGTLVDDFYTFDVSYPIMPNVEINIREKSKLTNRGKLRRMNKAEVISK